MKNIPINQEFRNVWGEHIAGKKITNLEYLKREWPQDNLHEDEGFILTFENGYKQYFLGGSNSGIGWTISTIVSDEGKELAVCAVDE